MKIKGYYVLESKKDAAIGFLFDDQNNKRRTKNTYEIGRKAFLKSHS